MASGDMTGAALYRTIWRWHFYAALLVMPLVLVLASSGAIYLFKPQIDRWEERDWRGLGTAGAVYPAAGLAHQARATGARVVVLNPAPSELDGVAHLLLRGTAATLLPQLLGR